LGVWLEEFESRLLVIAGDCAEPFLGLKDDDKEHWATHVDLICHCAGEGNWTKSYKALRPENVTTVQNMLVYASYRRHTPFVFLSSVVACAGKSSEILPQETIEQGNPRVFGQFGYTQAKWVAEVLVRRAAAEHHLPCMVVRTGLVNGASHSGAGKPDFALERFMMGCVRLGAFFDSNEPIQLLPVDALAQVMVNLCLHSISFRLVPGCDEESAEYNILAQQRMSWSELGGYVRGSGYPDLKALPYREWRDLLQSSPKNPLYRLLLVLPPSAPPNFYWSPWETASVTSLLERAGVQRNRADIGPELIRQYFHFFRKKGLLPKLSSNL